MMGFWNVGDVLDLCIAAPTGIKLTQYRCVIAKVTEFTDQFIESSESLQNGSLALLSNFQTLSNHFLVDEVQ